MFGYAVSRFQKSKILKQKFDIEVTAEMEELRTMCNLSEGIPKIAASGTIERISDKNQEDPFYGKANMELLEESRQQMENGQIVTKSWEALERLANG